MAAMFKVGSEVFELFVETPKLGSFIQSFSSICLVVSEKMLKMLKKVDGHLAVMTRHSAR